MSGPTIIDRRKNSKGKSGPNRQKFMRRVDKSVRDAVTDQIRNGKITDIIDKDFTNVNVPIKDIAEPSIHHGPGGHNQRIYTGNKDFVAGDRIPRPPSSGTGSGEGDASDSGEGEDEFSFQLSREEFLGYFFEDLELPDMIEKQLAVVDEYKTRRNGFSSDGNPSQLDVLRTMREAVGRRCGLSKKEDREERKQLKAQQVALNLELNTTAVDDPERIETINSELLQIVTALQDLRKKTVAFVDDTDMRFRQWIQDPIPATQAVVFCIMDVSGSMSQWQKDLAKKFYMLLYLFLHREYERIELVFIRHHTEAKEVDEDEFFYSRESGGTVVSSALTMMLDIAKERYNKSHWNIYCAQASDGDNWGEDIATTTDYIKQVLSIVQYYFYIEVADRQNSELAQSFDQINAPNFQMKTVTESADIYTVFRELFAKKD